MCWCGGSPRCRLNVSEARSRGKDGIDAAGDESQVASRGVHASIAVEASLWPRTGVHQAVEIHTPAAGDNHILKERNLNKGRGKRNKSTVPCISQLWIAFATEDNNKISENNFMQTTKAHIRISEFKSAKTI